MGSTLMAILKVILKGGVVVILVLFSYMRCVLLKN